MLRTHEAGTLRADHAGQTVTLTGWVARRRDHGGVAFLDLRDASGVAQVVARDEVLAQGGAHDLRNEYCVKVDRRGRAPAPRATPTPTCPPARSRSIASELEVLNPSAPLPFQIDERVTVGEEARLKHRYLDLRRPGAGSAGAAIRLRSQGQRRGPRGARRPRLRRDRDPDADPVDARGRPRLPRARAARARAPGTPCRRARSCSSSCSWSPAWSATTRSPAATATRTSAPTGSRSSPSSTSR